MIVFVLRHADRKPEPADGLTPAGVERAKLLARMLAETGVSIAYCSEAARAQQTLEPLAQLLGNALTIKQIDIGGQGAGAHVQKIVQSVKSQPAGTTIVVVSHSNTVGPIVQGLVEGAAIGPIADSDVDKLFVVFIGPTGSTHLLRLRYGAAT
jgi:phosphohistidine phosphatase SixA